MTVGSDPQRPASSSSSSSPKRNFDRLSATRRGSILNGAHESSNRDEWRMAVRGSVESPDPEDADGAEHLQTEQVVSPEQALRQLRAAHRALKRQGADRFDVFYRIYVAGLFALVGFYFALGLVDGATIDADGIAWAADNAPLWIALVAAAAITVGARSGANGGPLAIDELELHHVLLSPIDRSLALRGTGQETPARRGRCSVPCSARPEESSLRASCPGVS